MKKYLNFDNRAYELVQKSEKELADEFLKLDNISLYNQDKVLSALGKNRVELRHFAGTTGYGYDDIGRDTLNRVYADVFGVESAIVSPHILSGTHALTVGLFGILRPGDTLMSVTGAPYDTMQEVIRGDGIGSLKDFNINYAQVDLQQNDFDIDRIVECVKEQNPKIIYIQRSRGYEWRRALTINQISKLISIVKAIDDTLCVFVDNCYGEFTSKFEPTDFGADIVVGSLIKNIGGGIAPSGGYIAGKNKYIELIAGRLVSPSVGNEIGSYAGGYQYFYQGLFMAPHVTMQSVKGALLFSKVFEKLGYKTLPKAGDEMSDIICSIEFEKEDELVAFCQSVQSVSPVDGHVTPFPWDMPGYENQVIMAAGCFVQGASIELSADSPIKKPYIAYVQGGLTYEHVKIAVLKCVQRLLNGSKQ